MVKVMHASKIKVDRFAENAKVNIGIFLEETSILAVKFLKRTNTVSFLYSVISTLICGKNIIKNRYRQWVWKRAYRTRSDKNNLKC